MQLDFIMNVLQNALIKLANILPLSSHVEKA